MNTKLLGRWGEQTAADYLRKHGYRITAMGYSCRFGEIDLIAENKQYVVFAEVKLRRRGDYVRPMEYVTAVKQQRLIRTAMMWLTENETEKQPRFDVIEICAPDGPGGKTELNYIEDAFRPE